MELWQEGNKRGGDEATGAEVVITAIRVPYWDLVWLLLKLILATIPLAVVAGVVALFVAAIMNGGR